MVDPLMPRYETVKPKPKVTQQEAEKLAAEAAADQEAVEKAQASAGRDRQPD